MADRLHPAPPLDDLPAPFPSHPCKPHAKTSIKQARKLVKKPSVPYPFAFIFFYTIFASTNNNVFPVLINL